MEVRVMKSFRIIVAISAVAMFYSLWPTIARADDWNKATRLTFNQPFEIPGMVLPAGTYVFKRADSVDPHVIEISNADETHVYATLETISDYRMEPSDKTVVTFEEREKGSPEAIKSWFYPGDTIGEEFVYTPSSRKKDTLAAMQSEISELRNAEAQHAERLDSIDRDAKKGLTQAHEAATAAQTANAVAAAANSAAAAADQHAVAAQQTARHAMNQLGTVEDQIEGRIANLDKYTMADSAVVTFKFNSDVLTKEAMSMLDNVVGDASRTQSGYVIELQGFTDNVGTERYNLGLSDRRVESVLRYLVSKSVPLYRISLVGLGKADPIADNSTAGGREQNRRVEIRIMRSSATVGTAAR
jgi:outer membrane protein OmpA-like peptidoglycan-associated protein